jgi:hypothetical protein
LELRVYDKRWRINAVQTCGTPASRTTNNPYTS